MTHSAHALATVDAVKKAVHGRSSWMTAQLKALVEAKSFSGHEEAAQAVMRGLLRDLQFDVVDVPVEPAKLAAHPKLGFLYSPVVAQLTGCANLWATHQPKASSGKSLLINGHVDVVPTGAAALWARDPFETYIEDGWFFGRGAGDMKSGLICVVTALQALRDLGFVPAAPFYFNSVVEEECTGNGALASAAYAHDHAIQIDAMLDPEPFGETLLSAQVGTVWGQFHLVGRPAHAAYAQQGINPIEAAMHVWQALKVLEAQWNEPARKHAAFTDIAHPLNFNLGKIAGGEWASSVPTTCRVDFRFGIYPGRDPAEAKAEVEATIRAALAELAARKEAPRCTITWEGFHAPGCEVDLTAAPMTLLADCHTQLHGSGPRAGALTGTTDLRHFILGLGIPSTCYGAHAKNIHGLDECVSLASMERVAMTYALFIAQWCGLESV